MSDEDGLGIRYMLQVKHGRHDWIDWWSGPLPQKRIDDMGGAEAVLKAFAIPGGEMRVVSWVPQVVASS